MNVKRRYLFFIIMTLSACIEINAQNIGASPEYIKALTADWKGERFEDGRPKVSDNLLERLKKVTDAYGKESYGTVIGSNLGNGVFANSKRGIIVYGHVRDMEGLQKISGFNGWIKGYDPSYMRKTLLTSINAPIRIGHATVLPGDAVLAKKNGVLFIPAHLVEHIVLTAEFTALSDEFGQQRIKEHKYTAGEIDSVWGDEINKDFKNWVNNYKGKLPMSKEELTRYLEKRNF